jgi:hypothetical protein
MKRHADLEGRTESAGPLFDAVSGATSRYVEVTNEPPWHAPRVRYLTAQEFEAAQKRDLGMQRASNAAARKAPGWQESAVEAIRIYARTHEHFATEDVRATCGTPDDVDPKAWGPAMKAAQRAGIVEADGFVIVNCSNRSPRVRWRSCVFEGRRA